MKKSLPLLAAVFLVFVIIAGLDAEKAHSSTGGAPPAKTGSPGDGNNCTQCHGGSASSQANLITTNIPASGYLPGFTYQVTAAVSFSASSKFGFQVSPQNSSGQQEGTLIATNTIETQTQSSGKYITHLSAGTAGSGSRAWTFNWTAPASGSGPVTFYGAFNCSDASNTSAGDAIFLSNTTVTEDLTGIAEAGGRKTVFEVYPNPVRDILHLKTEANTVPAIRIYGLEGKTVRAENSLQADSEGLLQLDMSALPAGVYFIHLSSSSGQGLQKFIKL